MKNKMSILLFCMVLLFCAGSNLYGQSKAPRPTHYVCMPCGQDCDRQVYNKSGTCAHCNMPLVKKSGIVFKTIQPSAICRYIAAHPDVVLLDVRTKEEFEGRADPNFGRLKNAINIPIQELDTRVGELKTFKNREIIVYCSHSHRSPRASYSLTQNGFKKVTNMAGGMSVMLDNSCKK